MSRALTLKDLVERARAASTPREAWGEGLDAAWLEMARGAMMQQQQADEEFSRAIIDAAVAKWYGSQYSSDGCDDVGPAHEPVPAQPQAYGGVCRHCGQYDEYPVQGPDGKVCCWHCTGRQP